MKSFILCLIAGITLLTGSATHAQDSIPPPVKDSLRADSTAVRPDSTRPGELQRERLDSTNKDSSSPAVHSTTASVPVGKPPVDATPIVDIFEEIAQARAKLEQAINMQRGAKEARMPDTDSARQPSGTLNDSFGSVLHSIDSTGGIATADTLQLKDTIQSIFMLPEDEVPGGHRRDSAAAPPQQQATPLVTQDTVLMLPVASAQRDSMAEPPNTPPLVPTDSIHQSIQEATSKPAPTEMEDSMVSILDSSLVFEQAAEVVNTPFTELFRPYSTFDKQTSISSTTSLTILQQNVDYKTSTDFTTQYQRTGEKSGNFVFDVAVTKLNTEVETMGVQLKYDSNQKDDSTSTFAKPLFDIVGKRTFIEVDSTGRITGVDSSELGRQVNSVLSGLSLSGGDFEIGSNFGLLASSSGISSIGDSWTDSVNNGNNQSVINYKVQSIVNGEMLVTISGTVSQNGVISSDGAQFITHFTGVQKGKMHIDQKTLLVKSRDITLTMSGNVDYNGHNLPATAVSTIKEKVTANGCKTIFQVMPL